MAVNQAAIKLMPAVAMTSTTNELLYGLLTGLNCIGYEEIAVDETAVKTLTVPSAYALYATIVVEADATVADSSKVLRITEDNITIPTNTAGGDDGMPLGELTVYDVKGAVNLAAFKMIGREAGKTHSVRVQYYG